MSRAFKNFMLIDKMPDTLLRFIPYDHKLAEEPTLFDCEQEVEYKSNSNRAGLARSQENRNEIRDILVMMLKYPKPKKCCKRPNYIRKVFTCRTGF